MSDKIKSGYSGKAEQLINNSGVSIGDKILVTRVDGYTIEGILLPRAEIGMDDEHILIKLKNGYNMGIHIKNISKIEKVGESIKIEPKPPEVPMMLKEDLPSVAILTTGGTIASRVDYHSGAVYPAYDARDLYNIVPELSEIAKLDAKLLFSVFSEDINASHWSAMAQEIKKYVKNGFDGVVITHGTDTMGYTAAALSFALRNLPIPIVLVGAQRSSDRPSSDAALNLKSAVLIAGRAPFSYVTIVMHASSSDKYCYAHLGTKVRKNHTSRRDAFQSVNTIPIARSDGQKIEMIWQNFVPRDKDRPLEIQDKFDSRVALIKVYPNISPDILNFLIDNDYHGIVLEGTGLGHTPSSLYDPIKRAKKEGIPIVMTSQCIWGRINMNVYRTGRELQALGVIPGEDMLPETALVKLMWVLGQTQDYEEVRKLMRTNIAGEITERTSFNEYIANVSGDKNEN
ncbi:MAG: Glu-tRNA(Gln) amidotransferase subunit GatD [Candidatus Asgardarchaeia archaeon]